MVAILFRGKSVKAWWFIYASVNLFITAPDNVRCLAITQTHVDSLWWRHNGHDGVSNHRRLDYVLNRLFRCKSKKTSKLHVTGLCVGNSPVTDECPAQRPVTQEIFPFDDVIMYFENLMSKIVGHFVQAPMFKMNYLCTSFIGNIHQSFDSMS